MPDSVWRKYEQIGGGFALLIFLLRFNGSVGLPYHKTGRCVALDQRCHSLGFLPRSLVFRYNLGICPEGLGFFSRVFKTPWVFLVFLTFYRKIHLLKWFLASSKKL